MAALAGLSADAKRWDSNFRRGETLGFEFQARSYSLFGFETVNHIKPICRNWHSQYESARRFRIKLISDLISCISHQKNIFLRLGAY